MAKRARKTKNQQHQQGEVINLTNYRKRERSVTILPKNLRQEDYLDLLDNDSKNIVLAMGPAGTGKTLLAVLAAIRAYKNGECEKIVVTRPAGSGMYWIEDKVENAELGAKLGLTCLLINHGHNQDCDNPNIKRVANWADVVSNIVS